VVADNLPRGASFHFALPTKIEAKSEPPASLARLPRGTVAPRFNQKLAVSRMESDGCPDLVGSYNYLLVALSVLIAIFASDAALHLAGRVNAAGGWDSRGLAAWGAVRWGTGIWSMHYIGMLAFILPIPVAYHWPTVLLSLFAAFWLRSLR